MIQWWAIDIQLPRVGKVRGIVGTRGKIVVLGPANLARSFSHRALRISELALLGRVERTPRPALTATVKQSLEHKWAQARTPHEVLSVGRFLQFADDVIRELRARGKRQRGN